jgi:membrane protease YdiL (CAAX protease family)
MDRKGDLLSGAAPSGPSEGSRLSERPWRAFLIMLAIQGILVYLVGFVLYGVIKLPKDISNTEALSTVLLLSVSGFLAYVIAPFFLRIHFPAVFAGRALISTLGQVVWAALFGLFYGYLVIKTDSLFPAMIVHWLSNVFQAPLTAYWQTAPIEIRTLYGIVFGYGLATLILICWVRFFSKRWLSHYK